MGSLKYLLANTGDMALKRRAKRIMAELNPKRGEKIIDIGCGDGYYLHLLSHLGISDLHLSGTDYDIKGLDKTKKNLDNSKIKIYSGDLMKKLPFENNFFDKILCIETLEHVINPERVLKEFYRVLKSSGTLIITYPTKAIVERIYEFLVPKKKFIISEHLTNYSYSQLKNKLEVTKFKIIQKKGLFFSS